MFAKIKLNLILDALITIAIGCVLLFWPGATLNVITRAIGILIVLVGAVIVLGYFGTGNVILRSGSLVCGVVVAVIGVWVLINPHFFEALIPIIAGIIIVFGGVVNFLQALSLWKQDYKLWWLALVLSLLTVLLGVLLFIRPIQSMETVIQIMGGFLIFDGVSDLWIDSRIIKLARRAEKAAAQAAQDAAALETEAVIVEETTDTVQATDTAQTVDTVNATEDTAE